MSDFGITARMIFQNEYGLDFESQEFIEKEWKNYTPLNMAKHIYDNAKLDEHSNEFNNIKNYYAMLYRNKPPVELTDSQRKFIENNAGLMRPFDMAKTLFPELNLKPLSRETQTVDRYLKSIGGVMLDDPDDSIGGNESYKPPTTDLQAIKLINANDISADYDPKKLNAFQKKSLESLKKYLHLPRFVSMINTYPKKSQRDLFEATMVQSTYDKPDLTSEEQNMYIDLCLDYVLMLSLQQQMNKLSQLVEDIVDDTEEGKKLSMSLADALSTKVQEYDKCQSRMQKRQESLAGKRSQRMKDEASFSESLTKLVELFKESEEREKLLRIAEARNLKVNEEIDRIESMPEYIARVLGVGREEILNN